MPFDVFLLSFNITFLRKPALSIPQHSVFTPITVLPPCLPTVCALSSLPFSPGKQHGFLYIAVCLVSYHSAWHWWMIERTYDALTPDLHLVATLFPNHTIHCIVRTRAPALASHALLTTVAHLYGHCNCLQIPVALDALVSSWFLRRRCARVRSEDSTAKSLGRKS